MITINLQLDLCHPHKKQAKNNLVFWVIYILTLIPFSILSVKQTYFLAVLIQLTVCFHLLCKA